MLPEPEMLAQGGETDARLYSQMVAMILVILVTPVQDQTKAAFVPPAGYASDDACVYRCVVEKQPGRRSTDDPSAYKRSPYLFSNVDPTGTPGIWPKTSLAFEGAACGKTHGR